MGYTGKMDEKKFTDLLRGNPLRSLRCLLSFDNSSYVFQSFSSHLCGLPFSSKFMLLWYFHFLWVCFSLGSPNTFYAYFQFSWILQNTTNGSNSYISSVELLSLILKNSMSLRSLCLWGDCEAVNYLTYFMICKLSFTYIHIHTHTYFHTYISI